MRIKVSGSFRVRLNDQIEYIARDKPGAAHKFKSEILKSIRQIPQMPYKHRKSIFFDRNDIRDLIYKGYIVVYKINKEGDIIEVFGFTKFTKNPFF